MQKDYLQAAERVVEDTEAREAGGKRRRDFFYVMGIEKRGASSFCGGNVCAGAGPPSLWPFMESVRGRSGACDSRPRLATNCLMGALRLGLARRRGARLGTWDLGLGDLGTLGLLVTGWLGSADGLVERRASSALALGQRGQGTERMREAKQSKLAESAGTGTCET